MTEQSPPLPTVEIESSLADQRFPILIRHGDKHGERYWVSERELSALLSALPDEQRERVLNALPADAWLCAPGTPSLAHLEKAAELLRGLLEEDGFDWDDEHEAWLAADQATRPRNPSPEPAGEGGSGRG